MSRPEPRKSSLAGSTPVTPPAPQPEPAEAPEADTTTASGQKMETKGPYRHKVSFYQDPADTARVRGAVLHTQVSEGTRSLSHFIHQAVMAEVQRLEAKYNDGQPFPPVAARELPQGRPLGD